MTVREIEAGRGEDKEEYIRSLKKKTQVIFQCEYKPSHVAVVQITASQSVMNFPLNAYSGSADWVCTTAEIHISNEMKQRRHVDVSIVATWRKMCPVLRSCVLLGHKVGGSSLPPSPSATLQRQKHKHESKHGTKSGLWDREEMQYTTDAKRERCISQSIWRKCSKPARALLANSSTVRHKEVWTVIKLVCVFDLVSLPCRQQYSLTIAVVSCLALVGSVHTVLQCYNVSLTVLQCHSNTVL